MTIICLLRNVTTHTPYPTCRLYNQQLRWSSWMTDLTNLLAKDAPYALAPRGRGPFKRQAAGRNDKNNATKYEATSRKPAIAAAMTSAKIPAEETDPNADTASIEELHLVMPVRMSAAKPPRSVPEAMPEHPPFVKFKPDVTAVAIILDKLKLDLWKEAEWTEGEKQLAALKPDAHLGRSSLPKVVMMNVRPGRLLVRRTIQDNESGPEQYVLVRPRAQFARLQRLGDTLEGFEHNHGPGDRTVHLRVDDDDRRTIAALCATYHALNKYGGRCTFHVQHSTTSPVSMERMATEHLHLLPHVILRAMPASYSIRGVRDLRSNGLQVTWHIEPPPERKSIEETVDPIQVNMEAQRKLDTLLRLRAKSSRLTHKDRLEVRRSSSNQDRSSERIKTRQSAILNIRRLASENGHSRSRVTAASLQGSSQTPTSTRFVSRKGKNSRESPETPQLVDDGLQIGWRRSVSKIHHEKVLKKYAREISVDAKDHHVMNLPIDLLSPEGRRRRRLVFRVQPVVDSAVPEATTSSTAHSSHGLAQQSSQYGEDQLPQTSDLTNVDEAVSWSASERQRDWWLYVRNESRQEVVEGYAREISVDAETSCVMTLPIDLLNPHGRQARKMAFERKLTSEDALHTAGQKKDGEFLHPLDMTPDEHTALWSDSRRQPDWWLYIDCSEHERVVNQYAEVISTREADSKTTAGWPWYMSIPEEFLSTFGRDEKKSFERTLAPKEKRIIELWSKPERQPVWWRMVIEDQRAKVADEYAKEISMEERKAGRPYYMTIPGNLLTKDGGQLGSVSRCSQGAEETLAATWASPATQKDWWLCVKGTNHFQELVAKEHAPLICAQASTPAFCTLPKQLLSRRGHELRSYYQLLHALTLLRNLEVTEAWKTTTGTTADLIARESQDPATHQLMNLKILQDEAVRQAMGELVDMGYNQTDWDGRRCLSNIQRLIARQTNRLQLRLVESTAGEKRPGHVAGSTYGIPSDPHSKQENSWRKVELERETSGKTDLSLSEMQPSNSPLASLAGTISTKTLVGTQTPREPPSDLRNKLEHADQQSSPETATESTRASKPLDDPPRVAADIVQPRATEMPLKAGDAPSKFISLMEEPGLEEHSRSEPKILDRSFVPLYDNTLPEASVATRITPKKTFMSLIDTLDNASSREVNDKAQEAERERAADTPMAGSRSKLSRGKRRLD